MSETLDILVVEDDPAINKVICKLLELDDYTAHPAMDGETKISR